MLHTFALAAALLTASPAPKHLSTSAMPAVTQSPRIAVTLHSMTPEDQRMYPGRQNWDKTEWYESQFKSAMILLIPDHVPEWHNGGLDMA